MESLVSERYENKNPCLVRQKDQSIFFSMAKISYLLFSNSKRSTLKVK